MKKFTLSEVLVIVMLFAAVMVVARPAQAHTVCGPYACQPVPVFEPHVLADYEQSVEGHRQRMTLTDFACNGRGREAVFVDGNPKHFMRGCWSNGPQNMIEIAWPNGNVAEIPYGELVSTPYGEKVGF